MNEQCPRCDSYNTQKASKLAVFLTLFGSGGCLIWVGFLFWPVWILAAALVLASPLGFFVPKVTICKECKYSWKSGEAKKYKETIEESVAAIEQEKLFNTEKEVTKDVQITEKEDNNTDNQFVVEPEIKTIDWKPKEVKHINFRVAGVTKKNEKGHDIQNILKRVANTYKREYILESFNGYTNREIIDGIIDMTEFEGQYIDDIIELVPEPDNPYDKNAIKVYITDANNKKYHVGYVGKSENVKLLQELNENNITTTSVEFTGGKVKRVDYDWEKDKDVVVTDEITRGLEVTVYFENEIN